MSLFLNTSSLHNHYLDCCTIDVSETIERDCLSVLHKLHDQVNGLQLVQVVVQPLARLFNPASLAALVSNTNSAVSNANSNTINTPSFNQNVTTQGVLQTSGGNHHQHDLDGTSTANVSSSATLGAAGHTSHSRSQSFASSSNNNSANTSTSIHNNSLLSSTSTYMMSPDTAQALIARLDTDRDVNWLMEIVGYGLSMPFSLTGEQDSVKDCCTIYCEWLASSLLPYNESNEDSKYQQLSKLVPVPIRKDPNRYARKILSHLYNVFLPRQSMSTINQNLSQKEQTDAALTAVSRQAVLCHRVLRTIETIAHNPLNLMDSQTWDHLLALLLTVNDKLLSAPTQPDDIGTQLHDRILGVLFELMLLASAKAIPNASLWKTFHEMSLNWRHRPALIDHWRRVTLLLTKRIVLMPIPINSRQEFEANIPSTDNSTTSSIALETAVASMKYENLSQTWYRFLNLIGNPVELSDPNIISRTDEFYHSACASDNVLDPRQHPCLNVLPQIFMNSMAGLRDFIESFLGTYQLPNDDRSSKQIQTPDKYTHNQSARGSIISLTGITLGSSTTITQPINSHQMNPSQQALAVTPTQSRRTGLKSVGIKGMKNIPASSTGSHASALSPSLDSGQTHEHPKSGSVSSSSRLQQQQFMQPRPSLTSLSSRTSQTQQLVPQFKFFTERPKCNSILHVFGDWLFSAALVGCDLNQEISEANDGNTSDASFGSSSTATEVSGLRSYSPSLGQKRTSQQKTTTSNRQSFKNSDGSSSSMTKTEKIMLEPSLTADSFEFGQAEAMAILCKIFSSKTSSEDISPTYLSRFYLCLQHCLTFGIGQVNPEVRGSANGVIKRQLLASVLINSNTLLQKDLDGINLLIPSFIKAIEFVFECNEKDTPVQPPPRQHNRSGSIRQSVQASNVTNQDLRRACIITLLNLLAYPFHFQNLVIRNCLDESSPTTTFGSLRSRLLKLLFVALQTETDATNMQILLGGLSLTIHDLVSDKQGIRCTQSDESSKARRKNESTSSTNTGGESTNNSLDPSNQRQEDTVSQSSFVFNSKSGFLVKSLHVTCHLLINIWKHDTQVSLAALELLTTIACVTISSGSVDDTRSALSYNNNNNNRIEMRNEYKQTTKWICDYICNQCSRPPPAHSRDMHSTIVAAYQCLSVWFYNHPYLLLEQDCVTTLMEVIELGVSGQKSKSKSTNSTTGLSTETVITKADKVMKPSSMRVREAAESLLNVCMIRARESHNGSNKIIPSYNTALDELTIMELISGSQCKSNIRYGQETESRRNDAYKSFKYFSDGDSVILAFLEGLSHDPSTKDSVICLLRTPFGKHCWKLRFNYYTEKSREKIIANKTLGLIKRPFQQSSIPSSENRVFSFPVGHNKSLYFNNSAKFFPGTIESLPPSELDQLVTTLDNYVNTQTKDTRSKNDVDKITKIFSHQNLAEHKVISECSIRLRRVDCEEPQPLNDLEAARILASHLGLSTSLCSMISGDKISASFVADLQSLDHQPVRTCDHVGIFYVRKNMTSPREILESVKERQNVSLSFFEWILELGQPTVVKNHSRWTGKVSNSWNSRSLILGLNQGDNSDQQTTSLRNQMLTSDHGGAIFDGERMTIYWSDMCQELAFLIPHRIERSNSSISQNPVDQQNIQTPNECDLVINLTGLSTQSSSLDAGNVSDLTSRRIAQDGYSSQHCQDQNSDRQSLCSIASDSSSQSNRASSQQGSPRDQSNIGGIARDQRDSVSLSRQSIATQRRKTTNSSGIIGCDTNIIICWLESSDDILEVPCETLLSVSEKGYLMEDNNQPSQPPVLKSRDFAKYFISSMKNGLYRVNISTSFGAQWLALPLVDGMTVSKGILSGLIRESILNLCRRRRLDADSYQPPHVKRRLKIQEIRNHYKISSRYESAEFYSKLFKSSPKQGGLAT